MMISCVESEAGRSVRRLVNERAVAEPMSATMRATVAEN